MMSKRERIGSMGMGLMCLSAVALVAKHVVAPGVITQAAVNAMAVTSSCFVGFVAYDSFKEALTGKRS